MASNRLLGPYSSRVLGSRVYPLYDEGGVGLPADAVDGPGTPVIRPYYPEHWPFVAAGVTEPDYLWTCQDASGNLKDLANNPQAELVAGLNVNYQQSVTGWTSKFVGITTEAGNSGFYSPIGTLWNIGSQSVFALMYSAILVSGGARTLWLGGGNGGLQIQAASAGQVTSFVSVGTTGTFVYENVTATVYPFCYTYDRRGAGDARLHTNKEQIVSTWVNLSDHNKGWGGPIASPQARHNLMAVWVGANAEQMFDRGGAGLGGKTLITNLGWPMSY